MNIPFKSRLISISDLINIFLIGFSLNLFQRNSGKRNRIRHVKDCNHKSDSKNTMNKPTSLNFCKWNLHQQIDRKGPPYYFPYIIKILKYISRKLLTICFIVSYFVFQKMRIQFQLFLIFSYTFFSLHTAQDLHNDFTCMVYMRIVFPFIYFSNISSPILRALFLVTKVQFSKVHNTISFTSFFLLDE